MSRPPAEELTFDNPSCPMCYGETTWEEGFVCQGCGCWWEESGKFADWLNPGDGQCVMVLTNSAYPVLSGRCIKTDGHGGEHHNGGTSWSSRHTDPKSSLFNKHLTESEVSP